MSSRELEASVISVPSTISPPSIPKESNSSHNSNPSSVIDKSVQVKNEVICDSPEFVSDTPDHTSQSTTRASPNLGLPADYSPSSFGYLCDNSRQGNLYLFTSDGNFASLSPQQMLDMKDLEKGDPSVVSVSGRPLCTTNTSPKPFATLHLAEAKNDKMISGYDGRIDGLSPLSVITVSAYHDGGHPSPSLQAGNIMSRAHPVLRYHPGGGDTMLSALNYSESDMLQEGGFEVPSSSSFGSLDGLLGSGIGGNSGSGIRLPDLLDGETYIEAGQDLQLSPQAFSTAGESFSVSENASLGSLNDNSEGIVVNVTGDINKQTENSFMLANKLKVKTIRPVKATSPSRPGTQPCPTCGKVFSNSSALTKHKLTHSDERKYVCSLCAKAFKRQDHLNGHMLTHRNKKPYECDADGCGKSYCDARSLRRHKENHHPTPCTTSPAVSSIPKQVTVIPGIAHFSSLQSSYPASVITSNSSCSSESIAMGNRIQYAPPPSHPASQTTTNLTSNNDSITRVSSASPLVLPGSVSHLQFLAFHQTPRSSSSLATETRTERTVLTASWPPQTINTGALLLTQNLDTSQRKPKPAQMIAGTFSISSPDQGKISVSPSMLTEIKEEPSSLDESPPPPPENDNNEQTRTFEKDSNQRLINDGAEDSPFSELVANQDSMDNGCPNTNGQLPIHPSSMVKKEGNCSSIESPLLQHLLNQQNPPETSVNRVPTSYADYTFLSSLSEPQASQSNNSTQQSQVIVPHWSQGRYAAGTCRPFNQDPKPVECSLCQRKFKNVPALNGHMRLHGGYFKKEGDSKKSDKKGNSHSPLTTASTNVRALIEEKIIQKRSIVENSSTAFIKSNDSPPVRQVFNFQSDDIVASTITVKQEPQSPYLVQSPIQSPIAQDSTTFTDFPLPSHNSLPFDSETPALVDSLLSDDWLRKLDLKQQFRVPRPPGEKYRRHSDSDHFIPSKRPCTSYTSSALADLLRRKVVAKRTCRTGSDPGEPLPFDALAFSELSTAFDFLPKFTSNTLDDPLQRGLVDPSTTEDSALPILSAEDIPDAQPAMEGMKDGPDIEDTCLDKNVFFDTSNTHLPIGQPFPDISVSELEMMQLTTPVTSVSTISCDVVMASSSGDKLRAGEDSNDDDVFLSPTTLPTSPIKVKRKHKPEPLYIPPYVNTCGFTSRLRSPRLWDPSNPDHKKLSPPPYTPPPMLSPVRSGAGLFWHIISGSGSLTPKSAPHTPSFGYPRKSSIGEPSFEDEEALSEAPESDILPHVNIGPYYQARLPYYNSNAKDAQYCKHKADKVWDPSTVAHLSDEEVDAFVELSCCAVVPGGGRNKEYAFHLLQLCKGKIQEAVLSLMDRSPKLPSSHFLRSFKYLENDKWSQDEVELYHQGLLRCDKDFYSIAKEIPTKSVKQCIQFYYLWKKVCPDEYKRIRLIRRRKEQESLYYNLRSKDEEEEAAVVTKSQIQSNDIAQRKNSLEESEDKNYLCNGQASLQTCSSYSSKTSSHSAVVSSFNGTRIPLPVATATPITSSIYEFPVEPAEEFPCKICGKVFNKVKSRSAHMKSHRPPDLDKKIKYDS